MIAEQLQAFCHRLVEHTYDNSLVWKVINEWELLEAGFPDIISSIHEQVFTCEWVHLLLSNSFYCRHKDGVIALVRVDHESGKDGSHRDHFLLLIQIRRNSMIFVYEDEYLQESCKAVYTAIMDALNNDLSLPDDLYDFMCF